MSSKKIDAYEIKEFKPVDEDEEMEEIKDPVSLIEQFCEEVDIYLQQIHKVQGRIQLARIKFHEEICRNARNRKEES